MLVAYHDPTLPCHGIYIPKWVKAQMQAILLKFTLSARGPLLGPTLYRIGHQIFTCSFSKQALHLGCFHSDVFLLKTQQKCNPFNSYGTLHTTTLQVCHVHKNEWKTASNAPVLGL